MYASRMVLRIVFVVCLICGGILPTLLLTWKHNINSYPSIFSEGWLYLYTRIWFRVIAFLFGMIWAIIRFEYKYVDKLKDGTKLPYKLFFEKVKNSNFLKNVLGYGGIILIILVVTSLLTDMNNLKINR